MARTTTSDSGNDDKYKKSAPLNVEKLNLQPSVPDAAKIFKSWKLKFEIYTRAMEATEDEKFSLSINRMDLSAYEFIGILSLGVGEDTYPKKFHFLYIKWIIPKHFLLNKKDSI